jgi:hypothetical protein
VNHQINEEACPVSENMLGQLYRASPEGLGALIATVPGPLRAAVAHYCYRRAHLASLGLAIAASCERDDLMAAGINGDALYRRSRLPDEPVVLTRYEQRRIVTLATSATMKINEPATSPIQESAADRGRCIVESERL